MRHNRPSPLQRKEKAPPKLVCKREFELASRVKRLSVGRAPSAAGQSGQLAFLVGRLQVQVSRVKDIAESSDMLSLWVALCLAAAPARGGTLKRRLTE